jgi:hypothetical protein
MPHDQSELVTWYTVVETSLSTLTWKRLPLDLEHDHVAGTPTLWGT